MEQALVSGTAEAAHTHFTVLVTPVSPKTYSTYVLVNGNLLGGLKRLQDSDQGFTFTYIEDPNYGPYLQSVNGLAADEAKKTFWELLVKKTDGQIIKLKVGIGCYCPKEGEEIILNYTTYKESAKLDVKMGPKPE